MMVTPESVIVLKGCGPKGYPGMPETGNTPIPRKMLEKYVELTCRHIFSPAPSNALCRSAGVCVTWFASVMHA